METGRGARSVPALDLEPAAMPSPTPPPPPPEQTLLNHALGKWTSRAAYVAAKLGIADLLARGPKPVDELARATATHAPSLYRVLRALASLGIFEETADRTFRLTPAAEPLRSDVPGSLRAFTIMMGEPWSMRAWESILDSVRTGEPAFDAVHGKKIWEYFAERPQEGEIFNAAMVSFSEIETPAVLEAYDFSGIRCLADVGGGLGHLLAAVLRQHPAMHGILFDAEAVAPAARANLAKEGLADRARVVAGSFFETVPSGADACILKHILHDWDDERSSSILRSCRRALPAGGRVLVVDAVIGPGNAPELGKLIDLEMLVMTGKGRERTEAEFRSLLEASGFRLERIVPTASPVSVVEGRCA